MTAFTTTCHDFVSLTTLHAGTPPEVFRRCFSSRAAETLLTALAWCAWRIHDPDWLDTSRVEWRPHLASKRRSSDAVRRRVRDQSTICCRRNCQQRTICRVEEIAEPGTIFADALPELCIPCRAGVVYCSKLPVTLHNEPSHLFLP